MNILANIDEIKDGAKNIINATNKIIKIIKHILFLKPGPTI